MAHCVALDKVLAVGVDPHRESLDVVGIRFPEEVLWDEGFDNCRAGHHALWAQARALAAEHDLSLVIGIEGGKNYGYTLGRFLTGRGCSVKSVNPLMTKRQRQFYGQDKTNRLDALATAAIVFRAYDQLPDLSPYRGGVRGYSRTLSVSDAVSQRADQRYQSAAPAPGKPVSRLQVVL
jgi:transposase